MKNVSSFLVGTLSTLGLAQSIGADPVSLPPVETVPLDTTEALISVIGGAISTIIVALLKRWWKRSDERKKGVNSS